MALGWGWTCFLFGGLQRFGHDTHSFAHAKARMRCESLGVEQTCPCSFRMAWMNISAGNVQEALNSF